MKGASATLMIIIASLLIIGGIGKVTTAGYHCHWAVIGNSQVCE